MFKIAQTILANWFIGKKVFSCHTLNFVSANPGNVAIKMHQQVIIITVKLKPPVHPMYLTNSREMQVASREHNIPLHKYFMAKIQDYNESKL
jgi:hypothetical protein